MNFVTFLSLTCLANAGIYPLESLEEAVGLIKELRKETDPDEIGLILDFHGVLVEQVVHTPPLTLKEGSEELLSYLKNDNIPYVCATAWCDFNAVVQDGIMELNLNKFFDIGAKEEVGLEEVTLGLNKSVTLLSYQKGKITALKEKGEKNGDIFFRQKMFALEKVYPDKKFKYIIAIDDNKRNLEIMETDFPKTIYQGDGGFNELILYHLNSLKTNT